MSDILDYDPISGETVTFDYHEQDGSFTIGHHQDMEPLLDANHRHLIEADHKEQIKQGWVRYAAGITNVLVLKWKRELGIDFFDKNDWPKVMGLLNSREYRRLKCTPIYHDR